MLVSLFAVWRVFSCIERTFLVVWGVGCVSDIAVDGLCEVFLNVIEVVTDGRRETQIVADAAVGSSERLAFYVPFLILAAADGRGIAGARGVAGFVDGSGVWWRFGPIRRVHRWEMTVNRENRNEWKI